TPAHPRHFLPTLPASILSFLSNQTISLLENGRSFLLSSPARHVRPRPVPIRRDGMSWHPTTLYNYQYLDSIMKTGDPPYYHPYKLSLVGDPKDWLWRKWQEVQIHKLRLARQARRARANQHTSVGARTPTGTRSRDRLR